MGEAMIKAHEEKELIQVDVFSSDHADRVTTSIFKKTRLKLIEREGARCFICNQTAEEVGHPLEAHHLGIERQYAEAPIDWELVKKDYPHFEWDKFDPADPYAFVDNMEAQGLLLCKPHHTGKDSGIHFMPYSFWIMQRYLKEGYQFSPTEVIHHDEVA